MSDSLSFDAIFSALRSATLVQQWEFKRFLEGIVDPTTKPAAPAAPATEKKAPRKATKAKATEAVPLPAAEEAALLAPVDAPKNIVVAAAPSESKYRITVVNPALCIARKIDKKSPIPGTRPEDVGSNGKFYPELQCSKKPVAGSKLCKICAEKHAEAQKPENAMKAIDSYYGLLDEKTLYWNAQIVGSDKFKVKYPKGLPSVSVPTEKLSEKVDSEKVDSEKVDSEKVEEKPSELVKKPGKMTKGEKSTEMPIEEKAEEKVENSAEKPPAGKKSVKKATKATAVDEVTPTTRKVKAPPAPSEADEWEEFLYEGVPYIRHKVTNNCYLVNTDETELVRMVRRDCFEGKWKDGELDRYAAEDDA